MSPTPDTPRPTLYYDLGSPYAHLAVARAASVLGVEPRLEPVLVGGLFVERGHGSWSLTPEREQRIAEIEARAESYGIAPLCWPEGWPNNTLKAMRAAIWAHERGVGPEFARVGFRRAFAEGRNLSDLAEVLAIAAEVGLPADEVPEAIARQETKDALREATARAWELGVAGVPTVTVGSELFFGDDLLWVAAERLGAGASQ